MAKYSIQVHNQRCEDIRSRCDVLHKLAEYANGNARSVVATITLKKVYRIKVSYFLLGNGYFRVLVYDSIGTNKLIMEYKFHITEDIKGTDSSIYKLQTMLDGVLFLIECSENAQVDINVKTC